MEKLEYLLTWTNVPPIERRPGRTIQAWRLKKSISFILDSCFDELYVRRDLRKISEKRNSLIPARLELATFRVLHYGIPRENGGVFTCNIHNKARFRKMREKFSLLLHIKQNVEVMKIYPLYT